MLEHEPIRLIAVGDICPGDHTCMGFGTGTLMRSHGASFALQHLEFRGSPAFAKALRAAGFTVVTVANNYGLDVIGDTITNLPGVAVSNGTVGSGPKAGSTDTSLSRLNSYR